MLIRRLYYKKPRAENGSIKVKKVIYIHESKLGSRRQIRNWMVVFVNGTQLKLFTTNQKKKKIKKKLKVLTKLRNTSI